MHSTLLLRLPFSHRLRHIISHQDAGSMHKAKGSTHYHVLLGRVKTFARLANNVTTLIAGSYDSNRHLHGHRS